MAAPRALSVVESYYDAYRAGESAAVALALAAAFHEDVVVESPMVHAKYGARCVVMTR